MNVGIDIEPGHELSAPVGESLDRVVTWAIRGLATS
jgi:hypothetical protein